MQNPIYIYIYTHMMFFMQNPNLQSELTNSFTLAGKSIKQRANKLDRTCSRAALGALLAALGPLLSALGLRTCS
jgi:hypothetical protein